MPSQLRDAASVILASVATAGERWCAVPLARAHYEGAGFLRELARVEVGEALRELEGRGAIEVSWGVTAQHCTRARLTSTLGALAFEARPFRRRVVFRDREKRPSVPVLDAEDRREADTVSGDLCRIFDATQRHTTTIARADAIELADALRGSRRTGARDVDREHPYRMDKGPGGALPGGARGADDSDSDAKADRNAVDAMLATAGDPIDVRPWLQPVAVFNLGSVRLGGRVYRLAPQGWPKRFRARLRINGEAVIELDHPALHPRLLCAAIGVGALVGDFYEPLIGDLPRPAVKQATNTLWCADSIQEALGVITGAMRGHGVARPRLAALAFIGRFAEVYPALARFVACSAGRTLQNVDGAMARDVLLSLADAGAIGVHDSFIVPAHAEDRLRDAMALAFDRRVWWGRDRLRACAGTWTETDLRAWSDRELEAEDYDRLASEDRSGALL